MKIEIGGGGETTPAEQPVVIPKIDPKKYRLPTWRPPRYITSLTPAQQAMLSKGSQLWKGVTLADWGGYDYYNNRPTQITLPDNVRLVYPRGYEQSPRTYWEYPERVARYYNVIRSAPPNWTPPEWMDVEAINEAYEYLKFRNNSGDWTQWRMLPEDDPGTQYLRSLQAPPSRFVFQSELTQARPETPFWQQGVVEGQPQVDWRALPDWQRLVLGIAQPNTPALSDRPEWTRITAALGRSALLGLGVGKMFSFVNPYLGAAAALAFTGGMAYQMYTGKKVPIVNEVAILADALSEGLERGFGIGTQAWTDGLQEVLDEWDAAYAVSQGTYESGKTNTLNLVARVFGDEPAKLGEAWRFEEGFAEPVKLPTGTRVGAAQLNQARNWIDDGYALHDYNLAKRNGSFTGNFQEFVYTEVTKNFGIQGMMNDLVIQTFADPLNFIGFIGGKVGASTAGMIAARTTNPALRRTAIVFQHSAEANIGNPLIDALPFGLQQIVSAITKQKGSGGIAGTFETYRDMVRLGFYPALVHSLPNDMLAKYNELVRSGINQHDIRIQDDLLVWKDTSGNEQTYKGSRGALFNIPSYDELSSFEKWLGGLNKDWGLKELSPSVQKNWFAQLFSLTPAAQTMQILHTFHQNLGVLVNMIESDPARLVDMVKQMAGRKPVQKGDVGEAILKSPQMIPVKNALEYALRDGDFVDNLYTTWLDGADQRLILEKIAASLDLEPKAVLEMAEKQPSVLAQRLNEIAPELGTTPEALSETLKVFIGEDALAWNNEMFQVQLVTAIADKMDGYFRDVYGLKPESWVFRASNMLKGVQSIVLLGFNPLYFLNNWTNNVITRAADGFGGYMTPKQITDFYTQLGVFPKDAGLSGYDDITGKIVHHAMEVKDTIGKLHKGVTALNKFGIFSRLSGWSEKTEGQQVRAIATKSFLGKTKKAGVGVRTMSPVLEGILDADYPGMKERIYSTINAGMNMKQIEADLYKQVVLPKIESVIDEVAARYPNTGGSVRTMMDALGFTDRLRDALVKADTPDKVEFAFQRLQNDWDNWIETVHNREIQQLAEAQRNKTASERIPAVLQLFGDMVIENTKTWINSRVDWEKLYAQLANGTITDKQFHRLARALNAQHRAEWKRFNQRQTQTYKGIIEGLGIESDFTRGFTNKVVQLQALWENFWEQRNRILAEYFDQPKPKKITWESVQDTLEKLYEETSTQELAIQREMDVMFAKGYADFTGWGVETAIKWRADLLRLRTDLFNEQKAMRQRVRDLPQPERDIEYAAFNLKYDHGIANMKKLEHDGAYALMNKPAPPMNVEVPEVPNPVIDTLLTDTVKGELLNRGYTEEQIRALFETGEKPGETPPIEEARPPRRLTDEEIEQLVNMEEATPADLGEYGKYSQERLAIMREEALNADFTSEQIDAMTPRELATAIRDARKQAEQGARMAWFITRDMRQQLYDLGYSSEDVQNMVAEDAWRIINEQRTKPENQPAPDPTIEKGREVLNTKLSAEDIIRQADEQTREAKLRDNGYMTRELVKEKLTETFPTARADEITVVMQLLDMHANQMAQRSGLTPSDATRDLWYARHIAEITREDGRTMLDKVNGIADNELNQTTVITSAMNRWYFSQLQRVIETMPNKLTPEALRGFLQGKVKADELNLTGFDKWISQFEPDSHKYTFETATREDTGSTIYRVYRDGEYWQSFANKRDVDRLLAKSTGQITKQDALDYIKEHAIRLQETHQDTNLTDYPELNEQLNQLMLDRHELELRRDNLLEQAARKSDEHTNAIHEYQDAVDGFIKAFKEKLDPYQYSQEQRRSIISDIHFYVDNDATRSYGFELAKDYVDDSAFLDHWRNQIQTTNDKANVLEQERDALYLQRDQTAIEADVLLANEYMIRSQVNATDTRAKYSNMTLRKASGRMSSNYRNILIQWDNPNVNYDSGHWQEPNILAHIRVDDWQVDGKPTLLVNELQSDWHQTGRERGYANEIPEYQPPASYVEEVHTMSTNEVNAWIVKNPDTRFTKIIRRIIEREDRGMVSTNKFYPPDPMREHLDELFVVQPYGRDGYWDIALQEPDNPKQLITGRPFLSEEDAWKQIEEWKRDTQPPQIRTYFEVDFQKRYDTLDDAIAQSKTTLENIAKHEKTQHTNSFYPPQAPFAKNWHEVALKRIIDYAVENGYEKVAIVDGASAALVEGHLLVENISDVRYSESHPNEIQLLRKNRTDWETYNIEPGKSLKDYVGYDIEKAVMKAPIDDQGFHHLQTESVVFGGENMRWFYDDIVPNFLRKYLKRYETTLEKTKIGQRNIRDGGQALADELTAKGINIDDLDMITKDRLIRERYGDGVYMFDITKPLETAIKTQKQPLFQADKIKKGGISFLDDGRAVIRAFQAADISTMVHEIGHIFRRDLSDTDLEVVARLGGLSSANELKQLEMLAQQGIINKGDAAYARYEHVEEMFARGWERYLTEGSAPTPALKSIFKRFTDWMLNIYQTLTKKDGRVVGFEGTELDVNLNQRVNGVSLRDIFDRLLVEKAERLPTFDELVASRLEGLKADPKNSRLNSDAMQVRAKKDIVDLIFANFGDEKMAWDALAAMENYITLRNGTQVDDLALHDALKAIQENPQINPFAAPAPEVRGYTTNARGLSHPENSYEFQFKVIDLKDAITSHQWNGDKLDPNPLFPPEFQPRNRAQQQSVVQADHIASILIPEKLLFDARALDDGAPIVGNDNLVESGNGRVLALWRAKERYPEKWAKYQAELDEYAQKYNIDPATYRADIENPILVRERTSDVDRIEFINDANGDRTLQMTPTEIAIVDANNISDPMLRVLDVLDNENIVDALANSRNDKFIDRFMATIPENTRGSLYTDGKINLAGISRIVDALFIKVFAGVEGERMKDLFLSPNGNNVKAIESAIMGALPQLAVLQSWINSGIKSEDLSISQDIIKTVDRLSSIRAQNQTAGEYLEQPGLFGEPAGGDLTVPQRVLLRFFDKQRNPATVRKMLREYVKLIEKEPGKDQTITEGQFRRSKEEVLNDAVARATNQKTIFDFAAEQQPELPAAAPAPEIPLDQGLAQPETAGIEGVQEVQGGEQGLPGVVGEVAGEPPAARTIERIRPPSPEATPFYNLQGEPGAGLIGQDRPITNETVSTLSGRAIKWHNSRSLKGIDKWLVQNALDEAVKRGDTWNAESFQRLDSTKLTPADKDGLNLYLFGEENPKFFFPEEQQPITNKTTLEQARLAHAVEVQTKYDDGQPIPLDEATNITVAHNVTVEKPNFVDALYTSVNQFKFENRQAAIEYLDWLMGGERGKAPDVSQVIVDHFAPDLNSIRAFVGLTSTGIPIGKRISVPNNGTFIVKVHKFKHGDTPVVASVYHFGMHVAYLPETPIANLNVRDGVRILGIDPVYPTRLVFEDQGAIKYTDIQNPDLNSQPTLFQEGQMDMFSQGAEDLPLFSGVPMRAEDIAFRPKEEGGQMSLFPEVVPETKPAVILELSIKEKGSTAYVRLDIRKLGEIKKTLDLHKDAEITARVVDAKGTVIKSNIDPQQVVSPTFGNTLFQTDTITQTPEFRAWFGESKVVDENGDPRVVYHGTKADFTEFQNYSYFSKYPDYAGEVAKGKWWGDYAPGGEKVLPVFLSIEKPLVVEMSPYDFSVPSKEKPFIDQAKAEGYDGVFFEERTSGDTYYVPLQPEQVKSVFNRGTFDQESPNILYQGDVNPIDIRINTLKRRIGEIMADEGLAQLIPHIDEIIQDNLLFPSMQTVNSFNRILSPQLLSKIKLNNRLFQFLDELRMTKYPLARQLSTPYKNMPKPRTDLARFLGDYAKAYENPANRKQNMHFEQSNEAAKAGMWYSPSGRYMIQKLADGTYEVTVFQRGGKLVEQYGSWDEAQRFAIEHAKIYHRNELFQETEGNTAPMGRQPLNSTPDIEPFANLLDEMTGDQIRPLLGQFKDLYLKKLTSTSNTPLANMDAATRRMIQNYLKNDVTSDLAMVKNAALQYGDTKRNNALLNYSRRYGFDNILQMIMPYQFWYTRSMMNWAKRMIDTPTWYAMYERMRKLEERMEREGMPSRLRGKFRFDMPYLPKWMGGGIWADWMQKIFPFDQFGQPFEQYAMNVNQINKRAVSIIEEQVRAEQISAESAQEAISTQNGNIWKNAVTQAQQELDRTNNPASLATMMIQPALWWTIPENLFAGTPEKISVMPITRTGQTIKELGRDTFMEKPAGLVGGILSLPEELIRKQAGLSEFGEWGDYYIDRMLAGMAAEGEITPEQARIAMIDRKGAAFDTAYQRVRTEMAMKVPGATGMIAAKEGANPLQVLGAILASMFGGSLYSEGELKMRGLKPIYDKAWENFKAGDETAINKFFEDYPEYYARLALYDEPEERLHQFLIDSVWRKYMALASANRRIVRETLGDEFVTKFLNKDTRSYETIDDKTLAVWTQTINESTLPEKAGEVEGLPIEYLPDNLTRAIDQYYAEKARLFPTAGMWQGGYYGVPEGSPRQDFLNTNPQLQQYWNEKHSMFPNISEIQDGYFALPEGEQRKAYLREHPELVQYWSWKHEQYPEINQLEDQYYTITDWSQRKQFLAEHPQLKRYWDWKKQYLADHPDVGEYIQELQQDHTAGEVSAELSTPLIRQLLAYMTGESLSVGTRAELSRIRKKIAPSMSEEQFLLLILALFGG